MFISRRRFGPAPAQEVEMARIKREDHVRILRMIDVEGRKVADIAAEFGCSAANIYTVVGKMRRRAAEAKRESDQAQPPLALDQGPQTDAGVAGISALDDAAEPGEAGNAEPAGVSAAAVGTAAGGTAAGGTAPGRMSTGRTATGLTASGLTATGGTASAGDLKVVAFERSSAPAAPDAESKAPPKPARTSSSSTLPAPGPAVMNRRSAGAGGAVGARLAKPGFGLMMRTADGEENLTPFRSLDDLLSAIKPILRATARSSEPVWFCLQPVDLATIEFDAA
jgi:hypothetical protein